MPVPEYDDDRMAQAVQNACFAADHVAFNHTGTAAERTRDTIARALEALAANGIIEIKPMDQWPDWFTPQPPYDSWMESRGG